MIGTYPTTSKILHTRRPHTVALSDSPEHHLDISEYMCKLHIEVENKSGGKKKEAVEVITLEKTNRAAERLAETTRDSYLTVIDHAVGMQERNVRFFQDIAEGSARELRYQAESNRAVIQELVERAEKQRDALRALVEESVDTYVDALYAPLSYYKEGLRLIETEVAGGAGFPIPNYDGLNVGEISRQLDGLNAEQIRELRAYEKKNKNRETLIEQFDRKLKPAS